MPDTCPPGRPAPHPPRLWPAADEIARLHGSGFPLTGATVAEWGMSHFYFRAGNQVVWLGVAPGHAEEALRDLLAYLDGTQP